MVERIASCDCQRAATAVQGVLFYGACAGKLCPSKLGRRLHGEGAHGSDIRASRSNLNCWESRISRGKMGLPAWLRVVLALHAEPCSMATYPCGAQPQSIPAVPNRRVSLQSPTAGYPCTAQPPSIPAVLNH